VRRFPKSSCRLSGAAGNVKSSLRMTFPHTLPLYDIFLFDCKSLLLFLSLAHHTGTTKPHCNSRRRQLLLRHLSLSALGYEVAATKRGGSLLWSAVSDIDSCWFADFSQLQQQQQSSSSQSIERWSARLRSWHTGPTEADQQEAATSNTKSKRRAAKSRYKKRTRHPKSVRMMLIDCRCCSLWDCMQHLRHFQTRSSSSSDLRT